MYWVWSVYGPFVLEEETFTCCLVALRAQNNIQTWMFFSCIALLVFWYIAWSSTIYYTF